MNRMPRGSPEPGLVYVNRLMEASQGFLFRPTKVRTLGECVVKLNAVIVSVLLAGTALTTAVVAQRRRRGAGLTAAEDRRAFHGET